MKKLRVSLIILATVFSLVGCNSKNSSELEAVQKNLDNVSATIKSLEEKVEELSTKLEKTQTNEATIEHYSPENTSVQIGSSYVGRFKNYDEAMEYYKTKIEAEGKKVIFRSEYGGERIIVLRTTEKITNISKGVTSNLDISELTDGDLLKELNPDEVFVFTIDEKNEYPADYFSWTEPDGRIIYKVTKFNGKGDDHYIYE